MATTLEAGEAGAASEAAVWRGELARMLAARLGAEAAGSLRERYLFVFGSGYRSRYGPDAALRDIELTEGLLAPGATGPPAARRGRGGRQPAPRPPRDGRPPAPRRGPSHVPLQALSPRWPGAPLGLPADAREHGAEGRGRAPAPPARRRGRRGRGLAPRLRPAQARRGRRAGPRRGRRGVQGVLRPGLVARGAGRRIQSARPLPRPRLARDRHAPRVCEVPAADPLQPEPVLYRGHAERQPGGRPRPRGPVPRPLRPGAGGRTRGRRRRRRRRSRGPRRAGAFPRHPRLRGDGAHPRPPRSRREPGRGPDPAHVSRAHRRDPAHQLLPAGPGRGPPPVPRPQARPVLCARNAGAEAAFRDLRVLAAPGGGAPSRGTHRARRDPLVGPARGLSHRGARPPQDPDGEERGHRAGRLEGRVRAETPPRGPGRPRRRRRGLLPRVHRGAARAHRQLRGERGRRRGGGPGPGARSCRPPTPCGTTPGTPTSWSRPTRAPRPSPTPRTSSPPRPGSGSATPSPPGARTATTTRASASPPGAPGSPSRATSGPSAPTPRPPRSPPSASAT